MGKLRQKQPRLSLASEEYDRLKIQILERDGWKCQACGLSANLQVHHMRASTKNSSKAANGALPPRRATEYAIQTAQGLASAHELGPYDRKFAR